MLAVDVEVAPQVRLRVRRWPGDGGPAYLLVHGLSSNARLWDEVAEILFAAGHAVSAVDLRSHGDSDAPTDGYDTGTAADDLAAVCAALEPGDRVIVGGQSWGGNVAVRLAARHPERVAALALVDGGWIDLTTTFESWDECEAALRPADVDGVAADEIRRYFTREHSDWSPAAIEASMANLREDPDGTVRRRLSIPNHMRIVRSMWDDPPWRDFAQIAGPVLLMPALPTVDSDAKRALVAKAAGALANATIREYVGADHDLHAHRPADVAADLLTLASEA
jgi:pimeloyl-ACP methyl ester carboxylesterase